MRSPKQFVIATRGGGGGVELHRMWEWIRKHPEHQPPGFNDSRNSHWLRDGLRRQGWTIDETDSQVRLLQPDVAGDPETTGMLGVAGDEDSAQARDQFEFALESHLRDFIVRNLAEIRINGRRLRLFKDGTGREGVEFPTDVGDIDVLAADESGELFVFELKLARGPDKAMGQLTRYMGWIKKHLANDREVHGVLVARDIDEKLRYGALVVPNVALLEYEITFQWRDASFRG